MGQRSTRQQKIAPRQYVVADRRDKKPTLTYTVQPDRLARSSTNLREGSVEIIFVEPISDIYQPFVEDLESDWTNSTRFLVSIGKCK